MEDFRLALIGLTGDTPLAQIVQIRAETNQDRIKNYGPHEMQIRADWSSYKINKEIREAANRTEEQKREAKRKDDLLVDSFYKAMKANLSKPRRELKDGNRKN